MLEKAEGQERLLKREPERDNYSSNSQKRKGLQEGLCLGEENKCRR